MFFFREFPFPKGHLKRFHDGFMLVFGGVSDIQKVQLWVEQMCAMVSHGFFHSWMHDLFTNPWPMAPSCKSSSINLKLQKNRLSSCLNRLKNMYILSHRDIYLYIDIILLSYTFLTIISNSIFLSISYASLICLYYIYIHS